MATVHSTYYISPGKQQDPMIVPRSYQAIFFEGVQTFDATANSTDMQHGQHGSLTNVIDEKSFDNMTGTVSLKNLGHAWPMLRALCNQNPERSFVFTPKLMGKADVFINEMDKARTQVRYSKWYVDFSGAYSSSDPLDDASTIDIEFNAKDVLIFEGYQIFVDTFADTSVGDHVFQLTHPAKIAPYMDMIVKSPEGLVSGKQLADTCPIEYALRVWVGSDILVEPNQATIITTEEPDPSAGTPGGPPVGATIQVSRLYLQEPVSEANQMVKVMFLIPGDVVVSQGGVSAAPIMVSGIPEVDTSTTPGVYTDKILVTLSKTLETAAAGSVAANEFTLEWATGTTVYRTNPMTVDTSVSLTLNSIMLDFTGSSVEENVAGAGWVPSSVNSWPIETPATIQYQGLSMRDNDEHISPTHTLYLDPWG